MQYTFFALISRLKYIDRWALMRNSDRENVQEHSLMVAVLAHGLAVIRRDVFGNPANPDRCAAAAILHDAPEIFTGDLPTPVKYHDDSMTSAYAKIEKLAIDKLASSLPEELQPEYLALLSEDGETRDLVKAADKLAAYIKCLEELKTGNEEFRNAAESTMKKLRGLNMPEIDYFIENFLPPFGMTIDELSL